MMSIKENDNRAILALKERITVSTAVESMVLFGSVARGEATDESDVDILIVTKEPISYDEENAIYDMVFMINMEYDANLSVIVIPKEKWESPLWSLLPLHQAIVREGVALYDHGG